MLVDWLYTLVCLSELIIKLLAVDSNNQQSKILKDYNKYVTKVRFVLSFISGHY